VQGRPAPVKALDVSATYRVADGALYVNVLNRSAKDDIEASVENVAGAVGGAAEVWQMSQDDLKALNTFGDDRKVRPATKTASLAVTRGAFVYMFPKHSLTILKLNLK
jgi:alpha-L-arabinofuranosidase